MSKMIGRSATNFGCSKCLSALALLLLLFTPAHSYALHKHSSSSGGSDTSSDSAGDLKLPPSWRSTPVFRRSNHEKQSHLPVKTAAAAAAATVEEDEFNHEVLGDVDNGSGKDSDDVRQYQSSHGIEVADIKAADSLLAIDAVENSSKEKEESVADKLDRLIREINEESKKEKEANQVDNSFQEAEAIKAKLDFEINRTRLILMRLRSLQRNVADAHFLAKKLVESDVVSKNIKDYALTNLDKSVETVKKVLVKM